MKFIIEPKTFRAILLCAAKRDARSYLTGWHVDRENKALVASNGHILSWCSLDFLDDTEAKHNVFAPVKVSVKGDVIIDTTAMTLQQFDGCHKTIALNPTAGAYIDWKSRIDQKLDQAHEAVKSCAFDPRILAPMVRELQKPTRFVFHGELEAIEIDWKGYPNIKTVLMPCRWPTK